MTMRRSASIRGRDVLSPITRRSGSGVKLEEGNMRRLVLSALFAASLGACCRRRRRQRVPGARPGMSGVAPASLTSAPAQDRRLRSARHYWRTIASAACARCYCARHRRWSGVDRLPCADRSLDVDCIEPARPQAPGRLPWLCDAGQRAGKRRDEMRALVGERQAARLQHVAQQEKTGERKAVSDIAAEAALRRARAGRPAGAASCRRKARRPRATPPAPTSARHR